MKNLACFLLLLLPLSAYSQLENVISRLEIFDLRNQQRTVILEENDHFEAPNWSPDGSYLLLNSHGKLFRLHLATGEKTPLSTGFADKLNNDHGISPDGQTLVISHYDQPGARHGEADFRTSRIYTLPAAGGTPAVVTDKTPSFWHGWSPNGQTLLYVGMRNEEFDIYSININGGEETRLTTDPGLDDGPEFSADGQLIYYNSMRSGKMEIWQMAPDGSQKVQLTDDSYSNWFPHPSPDGRHLVFLSYLQDQGSEHPAMKAVALRLMDLTDRGITTLCRLTGGQGTINVPSWSPDGSRFAFVSYEYADRQ